MPHVHVVSLDRTERIKAPESVYDLIIDGTPITSAIDPEDFISPLGWGCPDYQQEILKWFLLEEVCHELEGRLPIFVCPMCGDFGCGVVTVRVSREHNHIIWSDLRWERDYDDWIKQTDAQKYFKRTFDAEQYRAAFTSYLSTLKNN